MRKGFVLIIIFTTLSILCSCQNKSDFKNAKKLEKTECSITKILISANIKGLVETKLQEASDAMKESFILRDTDIEISLNDCVCEYESDDFRIYSKYIPDKNWEYSPGYVIYLQTPSDDRQIFHGNYYDYLVDCENETIYIPGTNPDDTFESIYAYSVFRNSKETGISGWKVLSNFSIEEWLLNAHQLSGGNVYRNFSNLHVNSLSLDHEQNNVILKGEASGIYISTGEKYYIDWEYNPYTEEEKVEPCILKVYDPELDKAELEAGKKAFDAIERGDWSTVVPFDHMESLINAENPKWCRADVNGDGMPELISQYGEQWTGGFGLPIEYIFAFKEGKVELIFSDLNDYTEYYFLGNNGNLVYDYSDHGQIAYGCYTQCRFDEKWNRQIINALKIYYFYDDDTYDDEEMSYLKENFPDTYGAKGHGFYCFKSRLKTKDELVNNKDSDERIWEPITKEEFLEAYQQMTGFDFLKENSDWQSLFVD